MNKERLLKLVEFLKTLDCDKFDFSRVMTSPSVACGSVGCAIGWTPEVFPDLVEWVYSPWTHSHEVREINGDPTLCYDYIDAGIYLFDLTVTEATGLFTPNTHMYVCHADRHLSIDDSLPREATPFQVAIRIERFIKLKDEKENN